MSINSLELNGFLSNVEMSYATSGKAYTKGAIKFTVGKVGEEWMHEYLPFVAFGDVAEAINEGNHEKIWKLRGKLSIKPYTNKSGVKCKYYELVCFEAALDVMPTKDAAPASVHAPAARPTGTRQAYSNGPKPSYYAKAITPIDDTKTF